jgi:hypothetical protein
MSNSSEPKNENQDFSIVLGGPFFQLLLKAKLSGNALEQVKKRALILALFTWLPLLILSFISGKALSGSATIPFIEDIAVHIRYLVVVPLMIFAELLTHHRMHIVVKQFISRKLIPEHAIEKFHTAINSALKLRNSLFAEAAIVVSVYIIGIHFVWRPIAILDASAWYTSSDGEGNQLTLAGFWFGYISNPLFQFLLLRWYYRIFIWSRFLWQVSRIKLNLNSLHPDKLAGLGFLSEIDAAFLPLAMLHGAGLAALIADRILHANASVLDFKVEIVVIVLLVLVLFLVPLLFFSRQLAYSKRKGIIHYGKLGSEYVAEFEKKWLNESKPKDEAFIGSADIQSLADLSNSYNIVHEMQISPIKKETILTLAAMTLLPVLPLVLTLMPLEELAKKLFEIII